MKVYLYIITAHRLEIWSSKRIVFAHSLYSLSIRLCGMSITWRSTSCFSRTPRTTWCEWFECSTTPATCATVTESESLDVFVIWAIRTRYSCALSKEGRNKRTPIDSWHIYISISLGTNYCKIITVSLIISKILLSSIPLTSNFT